MTILLCNHKDCQVHRDVLIPLTSIIHPTWYCEAHRGNTQFLSRRDSENYRDCAFCNDVVAYGAESRHSDGQLFHVDCLIRMLKNKINDLKNPLTGEVEDDSIKNGFKKLRSALRERARIYNKCINEHRVRLTIYTPGIYKTRVIRTWGEALDLADLAVRRAVKELERLT